MHLHIHIHIHTHTYTYTHTHTHIHIHIHIHTHKHMYMNPSLSHFVRGRNKPLNELFLEGPSELSSGLLAALVRERASKRPPKSLDNLKLSAQAQFRLYWWSLRKRSGAIPCTNTTHMHGNSSVYRAMRQGAHMRQWASQSMMCIDWLAH